MKYHKMTCVTPALSFTLREEDRGCSVEPDLHTPAKSNTRDWPGLHPNCRPANNMFGWSNRLGRGIDSSAQPKYNCCKTKNCTGIDMTRLSQWQARPS